MSIPVQTPLVLFQQVLRRGLAKRAPRLNVVYRRIADLFDPVVQVMFGFRDFASLTALSNASSLYEFVDVPDASSFAQKIQVTQ